MVIGELERVIETEKTKEEIVPDDNIIFSLPKIPTIYDNEHFEIKQEYIDHLSLFAKSRKTNHPKSRKWPKTSIWAIF